jgi:hypothetical protein
VKPAASASAATVRCVLDKSRFIIKPSCNSRLLHAIQKTVLRKIAQPSWPLRIEHNCLKSTGKTPRKWRVWDSWMQSSRYSAELIVLDCEGFQKTGDLTEDLLKRAGAKLEVWRIAAMKAKLSVDGFDFDGVVQRIKDDRLRAATVPGIKPYCRSRSKLRSR